MQKQYKKLTGSDATEIHLGAIDAGVIMSFVETNPDDEYVLKYTGKLEEIPMLCGMRVFIAPWPHAVLLK